ncbi:MAG: hypothetical protein ACFFCO_04480 [Promethearchaeota archaeon]
MSLFDKEDKKYTSSHGPSHGRSVVSSQVSRSSTSQERSAQEESSQFLIEVDLGIHPYQGIIGCWQEAWSSWLEPKHIFYFTRDSPLAYTIFPGDVILCDNQSIYDCDSGKVILPIKKFENADELREFFQTHPSIKILAWDGVTQHPLTRHLETRSPLHLARDFIRFYQTVVNTETLTAEELRIFLELHSRIRQLDRTAFIFPDVKFQLIEKILEDINPVLIENLLEFMEKEKLFPRYSLEYLVDLVAGNLRSAAPNYEPSFNLGNRVEQELVSGGQQRVQRLRAIFIDDFTHWLTKVGTQDVDLAQLSGDYGPLKRTILKMQASEVEETIILVKGKSKPRYHIGALRKTTLGCKLLKSIKVSDRRTWIDQQTFTLVEAAMRRLKITLKVEPYSKPKV